MLCRGGIGTAARVGIRTPIIDGWIGFASGRGVVNRTTGCAARLLGGVRAGVPIAVVAATLLFVAANLDPYRAVVDVLAAELAREFTADQLRFDEERRSRKKGREESCDRR